MSRSGNEKHAVRCCYTYDATCLTPLPCQMASTYDDAEDICSRKALSLCRRNKKLDSICCNTGCDIDAITMWIADDV